MSWNVYLVIDTGGDSPAIVEDIGDMTWNVAPMYYDIFQPLPGGIRSLDGMVSIDAIPILKTAIENMKNDPKKYKEMNPTNGWGNYEDALHYLNEILNRCCEHPKTTIKIM